MQRLVKLNTNESPYGPSPKALAAIETQNTADLRLYPDPEGLCGSPDLHNRKGDLGSHSDKVTGEGMAVAGTRL